MKQLSLFKKNKILMEADETANYTDRSRLEEKFASQPHEEPQLANLVSYVGNKSIPILRLYRYKEAFAFRFVEEFISRLGLSGKDYIFDPFCGMGTTLFAASQKGISSIGVDRLPISVFIAQTLPLFYSLEPGQIKETFEGLRIKVEQASPASVAMDVAIMEVAFPPDTLLLLRKWKSIIDDLESPLRDVFLLLFFSIFEPCSYTSKDGQFLRLVREKKIANPEETLDRKVHEAERDIRLIQELRWDKLGKLQSVYLGDTRDLSNIPCGIKPIIVFAHPFVLVSIFGSVGYYRMLAMVSQNSMNRLRIPITRYESGKDNPDDERALIIAKHLNHIISRLIELDETIDVREFDLWRGMAAGSQAQGSWQNAKGAKFEVTVKGILQKRIRESGLVIDESGNGLKCG